MSDEAIVGADVAPSSGQIQFVNEQTTGQIRLQILDDDVSIISLIGLPLADNLVERGGKEQASWG